MESSPAPCALTERQGFTVLTTGPVSSNRFLKFSAKRFILNDSYFY